MSTAVKHKHEGPKHNGHGHSNGTAGPDPSKLRFHGILAEMEHLPAVSPDWVAQLPAWLRNPLQKARGLYLMVIKKAAPSDDGGYHISRGVAGIFIAAFLGMATTGGLGLLSQRDQITRLQTLQEVQERSNLDMANKLDQVRNYVTVNDKNTARLEGKIDQFMQVYSIKNADKAKLTFERE